MNSRPAAPRPWSERVVDAACLVFAAWTLACHASVVVGGSLWLAMGLFAAFVAAGTFGWRRLPGVAPDEASAAPAPAVDWQPAVRGAGLALALAVAWLLRDSPLLLWWAGVAILGAASALALLRDPLATPPASRGRALEAALWTLAAACAALALVAHRFDLDDSFYLNLGVAAVDAPGAALLADDTLHGVAGLPIHHPVYKLHSWELWNALLAKLTGLPVIACFHFVSAALAAALVPLAWARLFRRLAPAHWLAAVLALVWVLLVAGDLHRGYGNFAFVRIWQGKSVLLSVLLPVVAACALDFARRPSLRRGLLLAAVQIAALGCSSSALWAAPAVSLSATACALRPNAEALRRLGLAALASLYVLAAGGFMHASLASDLEARRSSAYGQERREVIETRLAERARSHAPGVQLDAALAAVVGEGRARSVGLFALLGAWALVAPGMARRYASVVPLLVMVVLLNPYASDAISRSVVGNSYWRTLWALPLPALYALCLTASFVWLRWRWLAAGVALLAGAAFATVPGYGTLSPRNDVRLAAPGYKVPESAYRMAELFHAQLAPGAIVVAPRPVSEWLPTFPGRQYPLLVRGPYLRRYRSELGYDDLYLRLLMTDFVSGVDLQPDAARLFVRGLERYAVGGVLLAITPETTRAREALRAAGFEKRLATLEYEIWVRG